MKQIIYELILVNGEFKRVPIIKLKEGSRTFWQVQAPKGILTFNRKRDAVRWQEATYRGGQQ